MVKNPQLLENLKKRERKELVDFNIKARRYDEMYKLAAKLNPHFKENDRHLQHLIKLAQKFREMSRQL